MVKLKQMLKRSFCMALCGTMVMTSGNFAIPGVVRVSAEETQDILQNFILNPSFEDFSGDNIYWWYKNDDTILSIIEDNKGHNGKYVKIASTGGQTSLAQNFINNSDAKQLENDTVYEFSFWVKADEDCKTEVKVKAELGIEKANGEWLGGDIFEFDSSEITVSGEWKEVKGSFKTTGMEDGADFNGIHFRIIGTGEGGFSFYADDVSITKKDTENPEVPEKGTNILDNPSFDGGADGWFATTVDTAKLEFINDGNGHDQDSGYVKVVERSDTWNSLAQQIKTKVKNHTKYNFSCWVKLSDEYTAESTVKAGLTIQSTGDNGGEAMYDKFGISNNTVTASKDEWRQIKGSFTANWNGELTNLEFKVADESCKNSFYVDDLSITESEADLSIEENIPSLKDYFASVNPEYDFKVGGALENGILSNENKMQLVKKHYNSVTAGNEMKPDYIIRGIEDNGSLKLDFTIPDEFLQYFWDYNEGKEEKDKIHVRGHVLCWYSQTPEIFFKDKNGAFLDKDAMNERLKEYIQKVIKHVEDNYPGLVYCWDVVNEAIIPADGEVGGLRVHYNDGKQETFYHQIYGSSNEYIINAFKYASEYYREEYPEKKVKLFYNDYGETDPEKVKCISELAEAIKAGGGRIDGIGMQSHHSMETPSAKELYEAIMEYGKHVDEVQITELDMLASKSYDGSDAQKEAELVKQAYRYKEFIDVILKAKDNGTNITALVFWGVADDDSWLVSPEFSDNRHNMPLLFDENLKAKPAYWGIVDSSILSPYINEENVTESDDKDWTLASPISIGENASVKFLWNNEKLYVQVTVKDATSDADDKITIYLDKDNVKSEDAKDVEVITINRSEAAVTADGYIAEKEIGIAGKTANSKIGIDVVVSDATTGTSECWNDTEMKQAERSKYYGTLTLKPFMVIMKGSADIDGEIDSVWNNITAHKLTVSSNKSVSTTGTVKAMWSEDYLYVLVQIQDAVLNNDNGSAWEQDSFEIFVDEDNGKTEKYETDDCQYRISYKNDLSFNGENCNADNIQSAVKETEDGYIVEARIKFNTEKGAENKRIGIDFQINDADASGTRVATVNWYDASGMGYAQPAVFGTAKLAAEMDVPPENPEKPEKPEEPQNPVNPSNPSNPVTPSYTPGNTGTPSQTETPGTDTDPVQNTDPSTTTEIKKDDITGAVIEITTTVDNNKSTVTEKVTMPEGVQTVKETITENLDDIIKTTQKLNNSTVNATIIINTTSKTNGDILDSEAAIHTGMSDIYSKSSDKIQIPESFLLDAKKAAVSKISLYIEKPSVEEMKAKYEDKLVINVAVPDVEGVSIGKAVITKESIDTAKNSTKKLIVKIESKRPSDSYTVTIPKSELAKMNGDINITINNRPVLDTDKDMQDDIIKILSANNMKTDNAYVVSIADNDIEGGIKASTPVLCKSASAGSSVYVYYYNKKTRKLEEIANSKRTVLNNGMTGIEGYSGKDYVVTNKELSGKNVVTLLEKSKVSVKKTKVKKGSSTKVKVALPQDLITKSSLKKNAGYGKQAAVIVYKSSDKGIAKVSKNGTIKAKGKGQATISVKIKLADGKVKTVKKKVTVK